MTPAAKRSRTVHPELESLTTTQLHDLAIAVRHEAIARRRALDQAEALAYAAAVAIVPGGRGGPGRPAPSKEELAVIMAKLKGNMLAVARALDRKPALIHRWAKRYGLVANDYRPRGEAWVPRAEHRPWMDTKTREGGA